MKSIRGYRGSKTRHGRWMIAATMLLWSASTSQAEYRLDVDDVVEIAVAGVPDLKQRVTVQVDGTISFPLLGTLPIRGLTATEVRTKIQAALATKVFRTRSPDGRENVIVIEPDQITAAVVEFRPIFVNGDVSKPGQQPYRPLTTVRQAVALAGGYELMRFRMANNPFLESADLRSEYDARWTEFIKEQARLWRLKTELGSKSEFDQRVLTGAPVPRSKVAEIMSTEAQQLEMRRTDQQREKAFLQNGIKQASAQIKILTEQQEKEEQGVQADIQELQKVTELYGKGSLPSPRVVDARRAVLLSATRKLQTNAQLMQAQKLQDDLSRQLERLEDQRKMDLLRELQDATVKLSELSATLQSVEEKLRFTGIVKSQLVRGKGAKPDITIVRRTESGYTHITADEDFELSPGDVVEIALREPLPEVPAQ